MFFSWLWGPPPLFLSLALFSTPRPPVRNPYVQLDVLTATVEIIEQRLTLTEDTVAKFNPEVTPKEQQQQ